MTSLNKICLHWTAGANSPCQLDLNSYHYCVDKLGRIYPGTNTPEDNINCYDGKYAKHCGGGNTGCIGLSACGMAGFYFKKKKTKYLITQKQIDDSLCTMAAYLSIKYGIPINKNTVFTHYEFDQKRPDGKREDKIDIAYLPYESNLSPSEVGNYLRRKVNWYRDKIKQGKYKFEKKGNYYEFVRIN